MPNALMSAMILKCIFVVHISAVCLSITGPNPLREAYFGIHK